VEGREGARGAAFRRDDPQGAVAAEMMPAALQVISAVRSAPDATIFWCWSASETRATAVLPGTNTTLALSGEKAADWLPPLPGTSRVSARSSLRTNNW